MGTWYTTREDVKSALDIKATARNDAQIDRAIEAASRSVESLLARKFYPIIATRYFDWPSISYGTSYRLWLDANDIISVTSLTSAGVTISPSNYNLEPANDGPPYRSVELNRGSTASFGSGSTNQRSIAIAGLFGYSDESQSVGTVAEALDASETDVDVSNAALIGVGTVLRVDDERMVVTGKATLDSTATTTSTVAATAATVTIPVSSGTLLNVGEIVLIDAEKMQIVDIAGNNLVVKRGYDGSVLAAHNSGAALYVYRRLAVTRAALGTTAATHLTSAPLTRWLVPGGVATLALAEATNILLQEGSGWARTVGSGDNEREAAGRGLASLRAQVLERYGRKARIRAV